MPQKAKSVFLNDAWTDYTKPLRDNAVTVQEFSLEGPLYTAAIYFERVIPETDGEIQIQRMDTDSNVLLLDTFGRIGQVQYSTYTGFYLDAPVTESGLHHYRLCMVPHYSVGVDGLSLACSAVRAKNFSTLWVNEEETPGSIALLAAVSLIGNTPSSFIRLPRCA